MKERAPAWLVVLAAAGALAAQEIEDPPPSPVGDLVRMLTSDVPDARRDAAQRLGGLRGHWFRGVQPRAAIVPLATLVEAETDTSIANTAMLALLELKPTPVDTFAYVASRLVEWDDGITPAATTAVARIRAALAHPERAWPGSEIAPHLAALLSCRGPSRGAATALAMLGSDGIAAAPALVEALAAPVYVEAWRAMCALACVGTDTALATRVLDADDVAARTWAAWLLRRANSRAVPASAVLPSLTDPRPGVRSSALAKLPGLVAVPDEAVEELASSLGDANDRQAAGDALVALGPRARAAVPTLVPLLASDSYDVQSAARRALAAILGIGHAMVPVLVGILRDRHPDREVATMLLATAPGDAVLLLMERLATDASGTIPDVALESAEALRELGEGVVLAAHRADAIRLLLRVLRVFEVEDYNAWYRALIVVRAFPSQTATTMPVLERTFAAAGDDNLRNVILYRLHELGAAAERLLLSACDDVARDVRASAWEELATLEPLSQRGAEKLADLLVVREDLPRDDLAAGPYMLRALQARVTLPAPLRSRLPSLLDAPGWQVACFAASAMVREISPELGRHSGFPTFLGRLPDRAALHLVVTQRPALVAALHAQARSEHIYDRALAAELLGLDRLGSDDGVVLLTKLCGDSSPIVRAAACVSLGALGAEASSALPALAVALADADLAVRDAAAGALRAVHSR